MIKISRQFLIRLKLHEKPAYKLCQEAGVSSTLISKLINGIEKPRENDPRIIAVGKVLGLDPGDCFEIPQGDDLDD